MTEEQALAFLSNTVVMCEDEDGAHFGVVVIEEDGSLTLEAPDRRGAHAVVADSVSESATAGAIAAIAGAKLPYADGEFVLLQAPNTQSVNAVYPNEPGWVEDTTSVCLGTSGLYALFSSMDPDALVAAAEGKSNPWAQVE